jgi:hypothetical protein
MATTYTLISSVTVGSGGAANIEFTSIPATYTDLLVKISAREESTTSFTLNLKVNNSSSSIYSSVYIQGDGSSGASGSSTNVALGNFSVVNSSSETANTFGSAEFYIPNYAGSNNKSFSVDSVTENNASTAYSRLAAGLFASSSAITQLTFYLSSGDLAQYSTAYLYGISNA